jgi:CRISPR-associated protein Cas2
MGKKKKEMTFVEKMLLHNKAGLTHSGIAAELTDDEKLAELPERIKKILEITNREHLTASKMLYFIMYDIENNKVRTSIAKYLEENGCLRVQKSIFFAESERKVFNKIHSDLKHIQELYDNNDSIFLVPVSTDQVRAMKIIGQSTDFDLIIGNKNTLFF